MWKKRMLCVTLALYAVLLCACQQQEVFPTENLTAAPTAEAQDVFANAVVSSDTNSQSGTTNYDDGSYDPASEEDPIVEAVDDVAPVVTVAPTIQSEYAGATPVLIDPIDKPTPTPLPPLTFTYATYQAPALHLSFDAPENWLIDDSQSDSYTLTNPDPSVNYAANMTLRVVPVNKAYSKTDLQKEVKGILDTLKTSGLKNFSPSNTATHSFLKTDAVYAAYTATTPEGENISGRVMVACVDKTLYILSTAYPQGYATTYKDALFNKVRNTAKLTN